MALVKTALFSTLAVSTRPPAGKKLSRFALEFSRRLRASVRSFISIHQMAVLLRYCCC